MTPKITDEMAEAALAEGGRERREVQPPPPREPIPPPAADLGPLTGAIGDLVASLQDQLKIAQAQLEAAQRQNDELRAMTTAAMAEKPVRLKPVRDLDPNSRTHLLIEYIDVIPVTYSRKLDS